MDKESKRVYKMYVEEVSRRTGLRKQTVENMFSAGWTYTEELNTLPSWKKRGPNDTVIFRSTRPI